MTEQEEQLNHRNEQLEVLNRIIRHDIRNYLNIIEGRIQLATDHTDPDGREQLEKAHQATVNAITLTGTARDFVVALNEDEDRKLEQVSLQQVLQTRSNERDSPIRMPKSSSIDRVSQTSTSWRTI